MEWIAAHDVLLCREMLAINPFKAKRKTVQRTKMWETIVHHLEQIEEPSFKVSVRSIRDRYTLLAKKFRKRMTNEQKESGISPKMSRSELDVLMEELTGLKDLSEEEKANESEEKNRKTEQDRVKALDMRKKAMEKLSETTSRKLQEENQPKKKARRSTSDTIEYLKERNEAEFALRREQLELKKEEQEGKSKKDEEAAKRKEDLMKMMVQQNQIMLQVISKLLHK